MKRKLIAILACLVSLAWASCSKSVFSNGTPVCETRITERFRSVSIFNNVNVKLVHSNRPHLELTCPKNLIENITTEVQGDTLVIINNNKLNWLRSTDYRIDLTVYYDSLREINYASIGELRCSDSIRGLKAGKPVSQFNLNINEGSGDIDLALRCDIMKTKFGNGTSHIRLRGEAGYCEHFTRSYGTIDARNLNSNITVVETHSTNDVYVWARTQLNVQLYSLGNIYYRGTPKTNVEARTNEGRLIPLYMGLHDDLQPEQGQEPTTLLKSSNDRGQCSWPKSPESPKSDFTKIIAKKQHFGTVFAQFQSR